MVDFFSPHVTGLLVNSNFSAMESERASERAKAILGWNDVVVDFTFWLGTCLKTS